MLSFGYIIAFPSWLNIHANSLNAMFYVLTSTFNDDYPEIIFVVNENNRENRRLSPQISFVYI